MPNNRRMAEKCLSHLKKRFHRDQRYFEDYKKFMNYIIAHEDAEVVHDPKRDIWYIPHHGVYHPKKKKIIRVVFDCRAHYQGISLN